MPKVSVIMPVYNGAEQVMHVIEAMRAQVFEDFELLICDDGSTDGTIAGVFSAIGDDLRISLHAHNHSGVSYARNSGLEIARGEYIAFLDVDDAPDPNWLATLVDLIGDSDMAVCGYDVMGENGERLYGTVERVGLGRQVVSAADFTCDLFSNRLMYQGYVWNKLFRRELVEKDDPVRFRRGIAFNEDRLFVYEYLKRCESVAVAGEACYGYRQSSSRKGYAPSQATEIAAFDRMATDLHRRIDAGEPLDGALHYLEKDTFRAAVELFIAADASGDPDAIWLIDRVRELDGYADEFSDYPEEFIEKIGWAVARAALQTA